MRDFRFTKLSVRTDRILPDVCPRCLVEGVNYKVVMDYAGDDWLHKENRTMFEGCRECAYLFASRLRESLPE